LREQAGPRVVFTSAVYGDGYRQLQSHAFVHVHATEVGGTHPALVEAMGFGNCVVVNDVPENREVAGDAALYFDARSPETLSAVLEDLDRHPARVEELRARASQRARSRYSWDHVTDEYEALFQRLRGDGGGLAA
jgi:glycosyltransferase involved in cell wall biosynthesis